MKLLRHIGLWGPVVAFMVLLLWISDKLVGPPLVPVWDKLAHVVIYGALALLCLRATHGGLGPLRAWPTRTRSPSVLPRW